ncbi:helix-turn-helix transcriptional regulator [Falsiroseomonas sp.]|uniref:helix-turn-helix transcriptional regulator n=1 Tax=Falsiroseomonas sp. TaxID=2870721 RepID=UPI003562452F
MSDPTTRTALLSSAAHAQRFPADTPRRAARRANRAGARALAADPLLTAEESAAEAGRALSTFWRDVKRGILPAPYYVTPRSPRWRLSELRAAVEAAPRARTAA